MAKRSAKNLRPSRLLPGWKRIKGTERFLDPSGIGRSKRQYYNARNASLGLPSVSRVARARKSAEFVEYSAAYKRVGGEQALDTSNSSEFFRLYAAAKLNADGTLKKPEELDNAPGGSMAQFLEYAGLREKGSPVPVGES